jgi:hypothetical protein
MCTYLVWYEVVDYMNIGLNKDSLCVMAINQMAQDETLLPNNKEEWSLHPSFASLLSTIRDCVDKISSPCMVSGRVVGSLP